MASLGQVAVGMASGGRYARRHPAQQQRGASVALCALALLPEADALWPRRSSLGGRAA